MVPEVENFLLANDEFKKQDGKKPNKNEKKIDRTDRNKDLRDIFKIFINL